MKSSTAYRAAAAALLMLSVSQMSLATPPAAAPAEQMTQEQAEAAYNARMDAIERTLHPRSGTIAIPAAKASLHLGDAYYFLAADEAKRVLVDAWGNPPETASTVLGMVFPKGKTFRDEGWGAVVEYEETGHIKDEDAAAQDYDSVLADMKAASEEANESRAASGYPASHIVGWAQRPTYDARTKTLIWARNIKFDGSEPNTLNYDVRTLGRTGVLSLNMIDSMPNLGVVQAAAAGLGSTVRFDAGARYADFNPSTDAVSEYGLAGLVAAGAGLAVAKKTGLIAILLLVLKKAWVLLFVVFAGGFAWLKRRFSSRYKDESEGSFQP